MSYGARELVDDRRREIVAASAARLATMEANQRRVDGRSLLGVAGVVFGIWWLAYGRTTPFPSIWYLIPSEGQPRWFFVGVMLVTIALVIIGVREPRVRFAGPVGVSTWVILSVWSTRRGDGDGLWGLAIPLYVAIALAMLLPIGLSRRLAHRYRSRTRRT